MRRVGQAVNSYTKEDGTRVLVGDVETPVRCKCRSNPSMLYPGEHCERCRAFAPKFQTKKRSKRGTVNVVGAEEFAAAFQEAVNRIGEDLLRGAKQRTPVDTGALRDSVRVAYVTDYEAGEYRREADARISGRRKRLPEKSS